MDGFNALIHQIKTNKLLRFRFCCSLNRTSGKSHLILAVKIEIKRGGKAEKCAENKTREAPKLLLNSPNHCRWPPSAQYIWSQSGRKVSWQTSWIFSAPQQRAEPSFGLVSCGRRHFHCCPAHCPLHSLDRKRLSCRRNLTNHPLWLYFNTIALLITGTKFLNKMFIHIHVKFLDFAFFMLENHYITSYKKVNIKMEAFKNRLAST